RLRRSERKGVLSSPAITSRPRKHCGLSVIRRLMNRPETASKELARSTNKRKYLIAFNVPESVAVQLKKHTPFGENVELEVLPEQKITHLEEGCFGGTESEQNDELIPPLEKNLIVEQELIQQLSTTINNDEVSSIFRRDIGS
ncbi:9811_t:CDS:2, partial [Funneliformis geosporum]